MTNMSETAYIRLDQVPFMLSSSANLFNPIMFMPSDEPPKQRLKTVETFDNEKEQWIQVSSMNNFQAGSVVNILHKTDKFHFHILFNVYTPSGQKIHGCTIADV